MRTRAEELEELVRDYILLVDQLKQGGRIRITDRQTGQLAERSDFAKRLLSTPRDKQA